MKKTDIIEAAKIYGSRFSKWLDFILTWECVYDKNGNVVAENDPNDRGGLTFCGLDIRSHPTFNYKNPTAKAVAGTYYSDYWIPAQADKLFFPVGEVVANYAVNMGLGASSRLLQRAVNGLRNTGLVVDGHVGPKTLLAANAAKPEVLAGRIEDLAQERYLSIVANNPSQRKFLKGWTNRNVALEKWWMGLS